MPGLSAQAAGVWLRMDDGTPAAGNPATAVCIDAWNNTRPCAAPEHPPFTLSSLGLWTSGWWTDLWSAAGAATTSLRFDRGPRTVSCGASYDPSPLLRFDFTRFQLNMAVESDMQAHFDTLRLAVRSCWR